MAEATMLPTVNPKKVGKQLRSVRRRKGLSLSEVARGAGLSRRELVTYERGKVPIPESDLWVLAGSCGVDVSELLPPVEIPALAAAPSTIEDSITRLRTGQDDYQLNRHLDTIAALRALPPGSQVQLQERELQSMVEALGGDPRTIEKRLVERLHISRDEAARLRALIVPSAPRYSPVALEAAPAPPPAPAPEPEREPEREEDWFGGATFEENTPSGPVDVFEELARLPEPAPLPHPETDTGSFPEAPSFRTTFPDPVEAVLVDAPATAAAAVVFAGDAPPIEVDGHGDAYSWSGAAWGGTPPDAATGGPNRTSDPLETREPTPWEPPPSAWDTQWASTEEPADAAPLRPVDDPHAAPVEIVEYVDEWIESPPLAPPAAVTTNGVEPVDGLGPWEHEPDPAATSSGFYVDWGTTAEPEVESPVSLWDPPTTLEEPASTATSRITVDEAAWQPFTEAAPQPESAWQPSTEVATGADPDPRTQDPGTPDLGTPDLGTPADRAAEGDDEFAPISWRPLGDNRPEPAPFEVTTAAWARVDTFVVVDVAPSPPVEPVAARFAPPAPEAVEEFVVAGSEWELGNAVPLVEVRGQGGLVMRRADERWALADCTTTPDFALEVEVDFRSGPGFGVLFNAGTDPAGHMSGYSFDVDPIHEGGSYLVRQWHADRELWNPIARVAAADPAAMHGVLTLRIVVVDDTMTGAVNGERVLSVESLKQACADRNREPASGDRVGIQAWSSSDLVIETLRVAEH